MVKHSILFFFLLVFYNLQLASQNIREWINIECYQTDNYSYKNSQRNNDLVVFMGNSITEGWVKSDSTFFTSNGFVGRGISGQTSFQFLLRFREDVLNLKPQIVVINAGTNDIAENAGFYNENYTMNNIMSMVELAKVHTIKVILTSVLPAEKFYWNDSVKDVSAKISSLNRRIKLYATEHGIPYVDYYHSMVFGIKNALNPQYTHDGVHPVLNGYKVMESLILPVIHDLKLQ